MADEPGIPFPGSDGEAPVSPLTPGSVLGVPAPPIDVPSPAPPIEPEPRQRDSVVHPSPAPTPTPTPAPPVQPEIPDVGSGGGGFPDILDLVGLFLVLALLALLAYITGLTNFVLKLVWSAFGRRGSAPQLTPTQLGQPVSNYLAPYVVGRDAQLGAEFTQAGGIVARVGRAILAAEETIFHAVQRFLPLENQVATQGQQAAHTANRLSHQEAAQAAQARQATIAQDNALARAHGLDQRLTALETHITTLIEPELDQLRDQIPPLQKGATIAWDEIKKHNEALGATGLAIGVAGALARLGGDWIRCDNTQALGESLCGGTGNSLRRLLEGALPLLAFGDMCAVIQGASELANSGAIQDSLLFGVDAIEGLLACTKSEKAGPLDSAYYAPGPLTALGAPGSLGV